jgi:hypothetical protein
LQMGPGFPVTIPSLSVAADHYNKVQVSWVNTIKKAKGAEISPLAMACRSCPVWQWSITDNQAEKWERLDGCFALWVIILWTRTFSKHYLSTSPGISHGTFSMSLGHCNFVICVAVPLFVIQGFHPCMKYRARLVQLHEQLHEQLHNFNSQTTNSLTNSLVSFSDNSLSQS